MVVLVNPHLVFNTQCTPKLTVAITSSHSELDMTMLVNTNYNSHNVLQRQIECIIMPLKSDHYHATQIRPLPCYSCHTITMPLISFKTGVPLLQLMRCKELGIFA